jgi:hypothetical protein
MNEAEEAAKEALEMAKEFYEAQKDKGDTENYEEIDATSCM